MIELRKATIKAAKYACLHFHYAKAVPIFSYVYNVYENGEWCGIVGFGPSATINIANMFDCVQGEVLELVRVALNGKQRITSECVSKALKRLHKEAPQVKIVVSFADVNQGHVGTIYQATNWIYLGDTSKWANGNKADYFVIHGRKYHPRSVYSRGWRQSVVWLRENVDPKPYEIKLKPKFKYIYVFNKRLRKKWLKKAEPYPKNNAKQNVQT